MYRLSWELPGTWRMTEIIFIRILRNLGPGKWYLDFTCWHHGKIKLSTIKPKEMLMISYYLIIFAEPWQVLKGTWRWTQFLFRYNSYKRASKACSWDKIAYQYKVNYLFEDIDRSDIDKNRKAEGLENHALYLLGGRNTGRCKTKSSCHTAYTYLSFLCSHLFLRLK